MDRGAWWATVHGFTKSWTLLGPCGAWWAAIYGVAQSRTWLKRLSSSSRTMLTYYRRKQWHPTPVLLPGKCYGQRSLVGCSPWGRKELDMTKWLHFHFSLSCVGEGNGNSLQCSCLENPRDSRAWWAAVYGVTQNRTWLKRLSSSSSSSRNLLELKHREKHAPMPSWLYIYWR